MCVELPQSPPELTLTLTLAPTLTLTLTLTYSPSPFLSTAGKQEVSQGVHLLQSALGYGYPARCGNVGA